MYYHIIRFSKFQIHCTFERSILLIIMATKTNYYYYYVYYYCCYCFNRSPSNEGRTKTLLNASHIYPVISHVPLLSSQLVNE